MLISNNYRVIHKELIADCSRKYFKEFFGEIEKSGTRTIVLLPDRGEDMFFRNNLDILSNYKGDIFLLDRGAVLLDRWLFHSVRFNPFGEGIMVGRFLYEHGHRNIVFMEHSDFPKMYWLEERKSGLIVGLDAASDGKVKPEFLGFPKDMFYQNVCGEINKKKGAIAIVVATDTYAVEIIETAKKMELEPIKDFSIISFNNDPKYRKYNLTTVAPPLEEVGKLLGEMICGKQFVKRDDAKISIKLDSRIIVRNTCK
jgi:DNA-binding LacI/PurR family transcriptional regulator